MKMQSYREEEYIILQDWQVSKSVKHTHREIKNIQFSSV